jgi:hypothetical protein
MEQSRELYHCSEGKEPLKRVAWHRQQGNTSNVVGQQRARDVHTLAMNAYHTSEPAIILGLTGQGHNRISSDSRA